MKAFECKMCGECCWGRGISLNKEEIKRISEFLGIGVEQFKSKYCVKKGASYELRVKESGYCIFLEENKGKKLCKIHPVKPDLCKRWPFFHCIISDKDEWKLAMEACPGINPKSSFKDFVKQALSELNEDLKPNN